MKRLFVLLAAVLCLSTMGVCGEAGAKNRSRVLSLCELVDNWKDFNRRQVRVRAIYRVGAEQTWLYDPVCRKGAGLTDVIFRQHTKGATKKLDQLVAKDKRAWVVFVGVFYGPELYQNVDPKLPAAIRERLQKSPRRYGHMDSFESMIDVTRVVEASEVAADVPASRPTKSDTGENVRHEGSRVPHSFAFFANEWVLSQSD
jgi:hypothetical protein